MVAQLAKTTKMEKQAERDFDYMAYAWDAMIIDEDEVSAYALVPSQTAQTKQALYKVRFAEPTNEYPQATDCGCYDHRKHGHLCKHMLILNAYYQYIYGALRAPAIRDITFRVAGQEVVAPTAAEALFAALELMHQGDAPVPPSDSDVSPGCHDDAVEMTLDCPVMPEIDSEVSPECSSIALDFSALYALTVGDYQKWLRKQIRANGRGAELGNARLAPIEVFVKEATGLDFKMLAGGEVEIYVGNERHEFFTGATDLAYWIYDDETGDLVVKAGQALDAALKVGEEAKLVMPPVASSPVVPAEEKAPETSESLPGDESIEEHFTRADLLRYEAELRRETIKDLRSRVRSAGLDVASRSKEPLIEALLSRKQDELSGGKGAKPAEGGEESEASRIVHSEAMWSEADRARFAQGCRYVGEDSQGKHCFVADPALAAVRALIAQQREVMRASPAL